MNYVDTFPCRFCRNKGQNRMATLSAKTHAYRGESVKGSTLNPDKYIRYYLNSLIERGSRTFKDTRLNLWLINGILLNLVK